MVFFIDVTDHYQIFTIAPINCHQNLIRVKFRDNSGQHLAKLKIKVQHYLNNRVQINQDVIIQIISVITYPLSIAIVAQSKNNKYHIFYKTSQVRDFRCYYSFAES